MDYADGGVSPLFRRCLLKCYNVVEKHQQMLHDRVPPCFQQLCGEPSRVFALTVFEMLHCLAQLLVGEWWNTLSRSLC
eukprot:2413120-Pyramimonas_sp.AAC.1